MSQIKSRRFAVSPSIIVHLIKSQAGSCGKAVAESVMNSIDAGANRIDITVDRKTFQIADDGHGFRSEDEILATFEVFGFDHSDHERQYGRFGLGRGQMWNFASTVWRTRSFSMDVDVRNRGLDYLLESNLDDVPGLTIHGTFYTEQSMADHVVLLKEIEDLTKYCAVPVYVNGKLVSRDPTAEKWTEETTEAYIKITETGGLKVYNQGIFVTTMPSQWVGVSGVLVTKRGHVLEANMARNDILRECPLWKRLHAHCVELAGNRITKNRGRRLNEDDRSFLAHQFREPGNFNNVLKPIFTLTNGKHLSLIDLLHHARRTRALTVSEGGCRTAEKLTRDNAAIVLSYRTLHRFGVDTIAELLAEMKAAFARIPENERMATKEWLSLSWALNNIDCFVYEAMQRVPGCRELRANKIPTKDLKPAQRQFLSAAKIVNQYAYRAVAANSYAIGKCPRSGSRKLILAEAEGCDAFTDGLQFIAISEELAEAVVKKGYPMWHRLASILVHEYLHDADDSGSHAHDFDFYENFHEIICDQQNDLVIGAMQAFQQFQTARDRVTARDAKDIDKLERAEKSMDSSVIGNLVPA